MSADIPAANDDDMCQPMHEWQTHSYEKCNPLHELDIKAETTRGVFRLVSCGGSRCAFHITDTDGMSLALKKGKFRHPAEPSASSTQDGMAMERLSKSPYVLNTYGYCGDTQILEFATGGNIHDLVHRARKEGKDDMPSIDKLRIAIQLITGVADLHTFEEDGIASITHNDICCHQFVLVDGVYKLNDFHLSTFTKRDNKNQICRQRQRVLHFWDLIHAPEEISGGKVDNEKADDYVVGNVMYYVLTKRWIFEDLLGSEGVKYLQEGKRSPFPKHLQNSKDPADIALMKGISMVWTHSVAKRPSSREVSNFLIFELEKITGEKVKEVVRVSVQPLPKDWDYSEDPTFSLNLEG